MRRIRFKLVVCFCRIAKMTNSKLRFCQTKTSDKNDSYRNCNVIFVIFAQLFCPQICGKVGQLLTKTVSIQKTKLNYRGNTEWQDCKVIRSIAGVCVWQIHMHQKYMGSAGNAVCWDYLKKVCHINVKTSLPIIHFTGVHQRLHHTGFM